MFLDDSADISSKSCRSLKDAGRAAIKMTRNALRMAKMGGGVNILLDIGPVLSNAEIFALEGASSEFGMGSRQPGAESVL